MGNMLFVLLLIKRKVSMEKKNLVKIIGFLVYAVIILIIGWYEDAQGNDWWMFWTGGIMILALLCMSAGGIFSKANYVNDSVQYRQYQKFDRHEGGLGEVIFYILLMLPLIYNMM